MSSIDNNGVTNAAQSQQITWQNFSVSLTLAAWALLHLCNASSAERWTIPWICPAVLQVAGSWLAWRRERVTIESWRSLIGTLPAFVAGGLILNHASPAHTWHWLAQIFFLTGTLLALGCLLSLGNSFAVFPARRTIVKTGPFSRVRHPTYACYLMMLTAAASTCHSILTGCVLLLCACIGLAIRIYEEERILLTTPAYGEYCCRVRYRIVPGIW